jgi:hypothetical protein
MNLVQENRAAGKLIIIARYCFFYMLCENLRKKEQEKGIFFPEQ